MADGNSDITSALGQRWSTVFDRLYDPATYTGVYAERFRSGPGINNDAEIKLHHHKSGFVGNTNTGTNEHIKDIKFIMRPNLNRDRSSPMSPMGRAAAKNRARYEASERAILSALSPAASDARTGLPSVYVLPSEAAAASGRFSSSGFGSPSAASASGASSSSPSVVNSRPLDTNVKLQLLFHYYVRFGRTSGMEDDSNSSNDVGNETKLKVSESIDSFNFNKFTRDCEGLLDKVLTPAEIDLIFIKVREKGARRIGYAQWLDALSAMATIKYPQVTDPAENFSLFLTNHVFTNKAAIAISQAVAAGLITVEGSIPSPRPSSRRSSQDGGVAVASPHSRSSFAEAGRWSAAVASAGRSPTASRGHRLAPEVTGPAPFLQTAPSPFGGDSASAFSPGVAGPPVPGSSSSSVGGGDGASSSSSPRRGSGSTRGGVTVATASMMANYASPPADVYELLARKALELYVAQQRSAAAGAGVSAPPAAAAASAVSPSASAFPATPGGQGYGYGSGGSPRAASSSSVSPTNNHYANTGSYSPRPWSQSRHTMHGHIPTGAEALGIVSEGFPSVRPVAAHGTSLDTLGAFSQAFAIAFAFEGGQGHVQEGND